MNTAKKSLRLNSTQKDFVQKIAGLSVDTIAVLIMRSENVPVAVKILKQIKIRVMNIVPANAVQNAFSRRKEVILKCVECTALFKSKVPQKKYCAMKCKIKANKKSNNN